MSNESLFENKPVVLIEVDTTIKSAKVLSIATDVYTVTLGLSEPYPNVMWTDLSDPLWRLSETDQQVVARYMWEHTNSSMTYDLAIAVMMNDKAGALKTLESMLEA